MKRVPTYSSTVFWSTYTLEVIIQHYAKRDEPLKIAIPITVVSADPSQAQSHVPLAPVQQLIDDRMSMMDL
jgi:hypothetical protein